MCLFEVVGGDGQLLVVIGDSAFVCVFIVCFMWHLGNRMVEKVQGCLIVEIVYWKSRYLSKLLVSS